MTLHGRARELAELDGAVRDARSRRAIVLTIGEAGIGKTALLDELRRRMSAEQILVLPGRAAEHERDVPFALVADALADHVASMHPRRIEAVDGDVPAILVGRRDTMQPGNHGPAERLRYHRALVSLLEMIGRERRFALVLDDLHSADDASRSSCCICCAGRPRWRISWRSRRGLHRCRHSCSRPCDVAPAGASWSSSRSRPTRRWRS